MMGTLGGSSPHWGSVGCQGVLGTKLRIRAAVRGIERKPTTLLSVGHH